MIVNLCLRTKFHEISSWMASPGPQWALATGRYFYGNKGRSRKMDMKDVETDMKPMGFRRWREVIQQEGVWKLFQREIGFTRVKICKDAAEVV